MKATRILFGGLAAFMIGMTGLSTARAANIGPDQEIYITTEPNIPSYCNVTNTVGSWYTDVVPGHLNVLKAGSGLDIECYSNDNFWHGKRHFSARFDGNSIAGFIYGGLYNGASIGNNMTKDGDEMKGYWTKTDNHLVVPMERSSQTPHEAQVVSNDEAFAAIPKSYTPRHYAPSKHKVVCDGPKADISKDKNAKPKPHVCHFD